MHDTFTSKFGEKTYSFRGKTFLANPATIQILNNALALNRSTERYVLVDEPKKSDGK